MNIQLWVVLLSIAAVMAALSLCLALAGRWSRSKWLACATSLVLCLFAFLDWQRESQVEPDEAAVVEIQDERSNHQVPPEVSDGGFVSSRACRECHTKYYESWHNSYHRKMTQIASTDTVVAPPEEVTLETRGIRYRFDTDQDGHWVEMVDPDWSWSQQTEGNENEGQPDEHMVRRKIVMCTGSHHYQAYWVSSARGNQLMRFPWVYHIRAKTWIPVEDVFITPPDQPSRQTIWNDSCIQCHAVHGQPGPDIDEGAYVSRVAEYGIACEACHGPGRDHVERQRQLADVKGADLGTADATIVNPARLGHRRSSQVCGQCHSNFSFTEEEFMAEGFTYRAGDDLHATRVIHNYDSQYVQSRPDLKTAYWRDGTMRLGGREFSAMDDSACYQRGELSCLSCHSMHEYQQPADQLASNGSDNSACLQCHDSYRDSIESHTHHAADSPGSSCYNCHMPHTSYALLKAIRSHRIDSPSATMTAKYNRPNACNLCHLDQTLEWTANKLTQWYGQEPVELGPVAKTTSAGLLFLLTGDAVQRAVTAWSFGWQPAQQASGQSWRAPFLALTLDDPYSAVRFTAYESLRTYPGFGDFRYDFVGSEPDRSQARQRATQVWLDTRQADIQWLPATMINKQGMLDERRIKGYLQHRDDRPMELPE